MKEKLINGYEVGKLLANLHKISKEMGVPFDDGRVLNEYTQRFGGRKEEIARFVTDPIYFPPENCDYSFSGYEPILPV